MVGVWFDKMLYLSKTFERGVQMTKKKRSTRKNNNSEQNNTYQLLLSSGVIVAIITGLFSCGASYDTNERLKELEKQKYEYTLQDIRYEKLQESLEYFSRFKVYDSKYINRFDITSENYSIEGATDMLNDSIDEFKAQLFLLSPYLSDDALLMLENQRISEDGILKIQDISINDISNDVEVNAKVKEHFEHVNDEFDNLVNKIIEVISYDIYNIILRNN